MIADGDLAADILRDGMAGLPPSLHPLVAHHAIQRSAALDPDLRDRFRAVERDAAVAALARSAVVASIRTALGDAGIEVVFLKGTALAQQVYPRPHARVMADIDVWVLDPDHPAAARALTEAGFVTPERRLEASDPGPRVREACFEATSAGTTIMVELHSSVKAGVPEHIDRALWASRITVGPTDLPALPLAAQLLHTCLHLARGHGFVGGLGSLVDIALILRAWSDADAWDPFCERTREAGAAGAVYLALELTRQTLGVAPPAPVLDQLRVSGVESVLAEALDLVWEAEPKLPMGVALVVGGGLPEDGWFRNRLLLRHGLSAEERRAVTAQERPPARRVLRYFGRRLGSLASFVVRGDLVRPAFWRRAAVARRRHRVLRDLARLEAREGTTPALS